ncbi:homer protein homolog 2-like [Liolophura sinensis]|uniref:homer protein homolog 2-like n=1 Tax=Liolophura sinensis TaxID=3198878 RepID=UPI0031597CB0
MNMGEQPIFTTKAHVFQIDPETKKNWLPASKQSVSVSYYYDSARDSYRIISVEGSKAIINSTITPSMTFTKTSQKFGQWSDPRANTVYGLGFGTETDLAKFIEKFKEVKEMTRKGSLNRSSEVNGNNGDASPVTDSISKEVLHQRTSSLSSLHSEGDSSSLRERRNSLGGSSTPNLPANAPEAQLKYENDRLKLALAQSSANAKKWEVELQTLKNNNARLTTALQESTANVEEWKKQLAAYKEESTRLKKKVLEMEKKQGSADQSSQLQTVQQEVKLLRSQTELLQQENAVKQQEIDRLNKRLTDLMTKETLNSTLQTKLQNMDKENQNLNVRVKELERQQAESMSQKQKETQHLVHLHTQLGNKMSDMKILHEQIISSLKEDTKS